MVHRRLWATTLRCCVNGPGGRHPVGLPCTDPSPFFPRRAPEPILVMRRRAAFVCQEAQRACRALLAGFASARAINSHGGGARSGPRKPSAAATLLGPEFGLSGKPSDLTTSELGRPRRRSWAMRRGVLLPWGPACRWLQRTRRDRLGGARGQPASPMGWLCPPLLACARRRRF